MSHSTHTPLKNWHHWLHRSCSSRTVFCSRSPHCSTVLQNGQDITPKASPKMQSIMEYSPGLPKDTKPLRSCSGNRAKLLLESHPRIKCHSQYHLVIRLLQYFPSIVNGGDQGFIMRDLETIMVFVLLSFSFMRALTKPYRGHCSGTQQL